MLALMLPFYLLMQFVGCLSVCAWEVAEHDNVSFTSESANCVGPDVTACSVENLPKLTASERAPRDLQVGADLTAPIVHVVSPSANFGLSLRPLHGTHFSPPIRRPLVLRI